MIQEVNGKVFIVTCGEYDEMEIITAFSKENDAKEYCEIQNVKEQYPDFSYEELVVDAFKVEEPTYLQAMYCLVNTDHEDSRIYFSDIEAYHKPFMIGDSEFVCVIRFNRDKEVMKKNVCDTYERFLKRCGKAE